MIENEDRINQLLEKLETLLAKQQLFSVEVREIKEEIYKLKTSQEPTTVEKENLITQETLTEKSTEITKEDVLADKEVQQTETVSEPPKQLAKKAIKQPKVKSDLEKFIGENLINKIGIAITVIGVAIGAKYSIEHDLISPLTRIILGYLVGLGLIGFGIKLKKKYEDFSAVLVSGAMAIMYFITFAAYDFYDLIPQTFAFILMLLLTAFTVVAAINYNKQVIAHIGLVGAYAVPFLLSENSGRVDILFSYMAITNIGILFISFKKYWKALYISAFVMTWIIYFSWYFFDYYPDVHFRLALIFLALFFAIFYLTFLSYKVLKKEKFGKQDILLLLSNSFIFYGVGYAILSNHSIGEQLLGLFTLCNAVIHFVVSVIIYKKKLADQNLLRLISGLVLVFITIAIPVQLDGNWVTLLWAGEAALLFWIGRTKNVPIYEKLSYPLMILALFSIIHDWSTLYGYYNPDFPESKITPIFNINFLSSLLFIVAFGFINFINRNKNYSEPKALQKGFFKIISYAAPAILLFVIYYAFKIEIETYWNQLYTDSAIVINRDGESTYPINEYNYDLRTYKNIWIINYTLLFLTIVSFINIKKIKNQMLGALNLAVNILAILLFLSEALYELSELRHSYLNEATAKYYQTSELNIGMRYISFAFLALLLFAFYHYIRQKFMKVNFNVPFTILLHISILWIASSELLHWMDMAASTQSDKLGLSILWGAYSLLLIGLGIWKKKKYLRISAIILFAVTLLKLFLYDIAHLPTISKTIVLVSLGIILLFISFLYNKYKDLISDETEN